MLKLALTYSKACKPVKIIARATVSTKPHTASILFPAVIAWWENVIVAPEQSKISVLSNGIALGSKTSIPLGGQMFPISIVGARLAAKKAQKKAKKNITSETMNRITPYRRPSWTIFVWQPSKVASLTMSLHQINIQETTDIKPNSVVCKPKV